MRATYLVGVTILSHIKQGQRYRYSRERQPVDRDRHGHGPEDEDEVCPMTIGLVVIYSTFPVWSYDHMTLVGVL